MREIKFRGMSEITGHEWVYGNLHIDYKSGDMWVGEEAPYEPILKDTVGQYTGLQDCTGAMRIYEGDILRDYTGEKVKVVWNDGAYWTTGGSLDEPLTETLAQGCKVIGNIYDGVMGKCKS